MRLCRGGLIHDLPSRAIHIRHPGLKDQPEELQEDATEREKDGDRVANPEPQAMIQRSQLDT